MNTSGTLITPINAFAILDSEELADTQKALIWKLVPDQGFSFRL